MKFSWHVADSVRKALRRPEKIPKGAHIEPIHHYHVRKRVHHWYETYPHPGMVKRWVDRAVYFVGVAGPIMTMPQLYTIWVEQNTAGVSLITWTSYAFISSFWLLYGALHHEKPIIVTQISWLTIHALVISGILIYN